MPLIIPAIFFVILMILTMVYPNKGGLAGNATEIYKRLLTHTSLNPSGRAVVVPDALGHTAWSIEEYPPFVCSTNTICERLNGITFFGQSQDSIFVYESGEALLIDHHSRVHWSRSQRN
ncbi:hypothetical protein [Gimesia maris]|nr:hypothetical protein [Gimesia maris]EDL57909.1 hypothetical protein PM8797T_00137 [Gimesia maris DSM 8797]QGQ30308.1 hypothetical protein F1729_17545 [Gimesia maris]